MCTSGSVAGRGLSVVQWCSGALVAPILPAHLPEPLTVVVLQLIALQVQVKVDK